MQPRPWTELQAIPLLPYPGWMVMHCLVCPMKLLPAQWLDVGVLSAVPWSCVTLIISWGPGKCPLPTMPACIINLHTPAQELRTAGCAPGLHGAGNLWGAAVSLR